MPSDNINRAIKKGVGGEETAEFTDLTYEVFGPHGVAILVELSTDNRNRSAAEIRSLLTRSGGSIATSGAVSRLFQRKGQMIIPREASEEDRVMELALDSGAEDFRADPAGYEIITEPGQFEAVQKRLDAAGIKCASAEVTYLPTVTVRLDEPAAAAAVTRLIDELEEHDDVKEVHANAEFPEEEG